MRSCTGMRDKKSQDGRASRKAALHVAADRRMVREAKAKAVAKGLAVTSGVLHTKANWGGLDTIARLLSAAVHAQASRRDCAHAPWQS